jgi:transcriptional regulator with XRE-family HTH domain
MSYDAVRHPIRAARRERALTQTDLARRSGTSRVTIARLEAGSARDVRVGTVTALCKALGLELAALPIGSHAALETLLARERERSRRLDLRRRHAALAARLLAAPAAEAHSLVLGARAVVDRWERERLCSRHYVSRWRAMLAGPPKRAARALVEPGPWTDALFQSTPWAFALQPPAA